MKFEQILPIITLLLGWSLNSFTALFQSRRENRRAVSKAIADLLEIRHELLAKPALIGELRKLVLISPADERRIWPLISQLLPRPHDLPERYNNTVTAVASFDPLLGFQLRSKDHASKLGTLL